MNICRYCIYVFEWLCICSVKLYERNLQRFLKISLKMPKKVMCILLDDCVFVVVVVVVVVVILLLFFMRFVCNRIGGIC